MNSNNRLPLTPDWFPSRRTSPGCRGLLPGSGNSSSCKPRRKSSEYTRAHVSQRPPRDVSVVSKRDALVGERAVGIRRSGGNQVYIFGHMHDLMLFPPSEQERMLQRAVSAGRWANARLVNDALFSCPALTGGLHALNTASTPLWI